MALPMELIISVSSVSLNGMMADKTDQESRTRRRGDDWTWPQIRCTPPIQLILLLSQFPMPEVRCCTSIFAYDCHFSINFYVAASDRSYELFDVSMECDPQEICQWNGTRISRLRDSVVCLLEFHFQSWIRSWRVSYSPEWWRRGTSAFDEGFTLLGGRDSSVNNLAACVSSKFYDFLLIDWMQLFLVSLNCEGSAEKFVRCVNLHLRESCKLCVWKLWV